MDGTLLEAWASIKSFRRDGDDNDSTGGRNAERHFHKKRPTRRTVASPIPSSLYKKGSASRPSFATACPDGEPPWSVVGVTLATGTAERAALALLSRRRRSSGRRQSLRRGRLRGGYGLDGEPARHHRWPSERGKPRKTSVDRRITRHAGYAIACARKRIGKCSAGSRVRPGWTRRGRGRVDAAFTMALAAYNLSACPGAGAA